MKRQPSEITIQVSLEAACWAEFHLKINSVFRRGGIGEEEDEERRQMKRRRKRRRMKRRQ